MSNVSSPLPEQGQLALLRSQLCFIHDVRASTLLFPAPRRSLDKKQPLLSLSSVADDGLHGDLQVICESEQEGTVLEKIAFSRGCGASMGSRKTEMIGRIEGIVRPRSSRYSSKIIKAGALLDDTKTLLSHWDKTAAVEGELDRIRRENVFGKASRSRVEDILAVFRQRYLVEADVTNALVVLVKNRLPAASLDRILYFHAARADALLHDTVTEILTPMQAQGIIDVTPRAIQQVLVKWVEKGLTTAAWSAKTTERVAQGLMSTLRDFGVLQGAVNKRIAPAYMPVTAFAYIAFYLKQHEPSGAKLLEHPDWKLFFLNRELVERFFFEANQHGLLEYHAAGTVTRLTFPADTLEGYANVLTQKSH